MFSERETVVELPFAADSCPCAVEAASRVTINCGIRDSVVQLVSYLGERVGGVGGVGDAPASSLEGGAG